MSYFFGGTHLFLTMSKRNSEKNENTTSKKKKIDLPPYLQQLQSTFEAVNIYCSFCNARLTSSVTLQALQKAVPDLTCQDLAAMNVMLPNLVKFNSVSTETLQIEFGTPVSKKTSRDKHGQALRNRGDDWSVSKKVMIKPDVIKKSIEQQNALFRDALQKYLQTCQEKVFHFKVYMFLLIIVVHTERRPKRPLD